MYMPTAYSDPVTEYWSLVRDVTLWDVSCQRQVEISGPDAERFVQLLTPRDISGVQEGQCRYVMLCDEDGGIVNDAVLLRLSAHKFWLSPGDGDVLLWAQGVAVHAGMKVTISEPDVSPLQLQGPKAPQVARALFGDWVLQLGYYRLGFTEFRDSPLVISRTGWSGELGYEIYLRDGANGDALWESVMEAGEQQGIKPIAPNLIRSIEGGILSYCSDITREDNPFTLGMDRLVALDMEADFIGKQALRNIKAAGVSRRLVGVTLGGEPVSGGNEDFWPVVAQGRQVGRITRCVYSPRLEKNIGFANIPASMSGEGTLMSVHSPQGEREATVVPVPFVPAQKRIPG
jgi:aminomethyltransferase